MTKECVVTGKKPLVGHNVSHAQNKTKRRFMPNLQTVRLFSEKLKKSFKLRVSTAGIRTIEHNGGLDGFVTSTSVSKLSPELRKVRKELDAADKKAA